MSMRRLVVPLLLSMGLYACASTQKDVVRFTGTTAYPVSQFVEVLESPPTRAFQEIGVVDAPGEPGVLRTQLLAQIRAQAAQIGADAVVLQDVSRPTAAQPRLNPATGTMETTGGVLVPAFKGIAIKFR